MARTPENPRGAKRQVSIRIDPDLHTWMQSLRVQLELSEAKSFEWLIVTVKYLLEELGESRVKRLVSEWKRGGNSVGAALARAALDSFVRAEHGVGNSGGPTLLTAPEGPKQPSKKHR